MGATELEILRAKAARFEENERRLQVKRRNKTVFQDKKELNKIYGVDINELGSTEIGSKINISVRNSSMFLFALAEIAAKENPALGMEGLSEDAEEQEQIKAREELEQEFDNDSDCSMEDLLDTDTPEAIRRKKRAGRIVVQFLTEMKEEERLAFIKSHNPTFAKILKEHIENKTEKEMEAILEDFEIVDSFLTGFNEGLDDLANIGVPEEDLTPASKEIFAIDLHNTLYRDATDSETVLNNDPDEVANAYESVMRKLEHRYAMDNLMSGDFAKIPTDKSHDLKAVFENIVPDHYGEHEPINDGKGLWNLLDESDFVRFASIEDIYEKFHFELQEKKEGVRLSVKSMKFDGIELLGNDTKIDKNNGHAISRLKNAIADEYYEKLNVSYFDNLKQFERDPKKGGKLDLFEKEFREDFSKNIVDLLKDNTHWYNSSKNYREMQKALNRFSEKYGNFNFDDLKNNEVKTELKADIKTLQAVVEKYLTDKDGLNMDKTFSNEYERKRVDAAREINRRLKNKLYQIDACSSLREYNKEKDDVLFGYPDECKGLVEKMYDVSNKLGTALSQEKSIELRENYETLCIARINDLCTKLNIQGELPKDKILEEIRTSPYYKGWFGTTEKPNFEVPANLSKDIVKYNLEKNAIKDIEKRFLKKAEELAKQKDEKNKNGGIDNSKDKEAQKEIKAEKKEPKVDPRGL